MSRSVPAQGEMAATAADKAERRFETLEKERKELMDDLMPHLQVDSPRQVVIELLKPKHAELNESLKSVNTRLETAGEVLAVARKDLHLVRSTQREEVQEVKRQRQAALAQQVCWRCACVCVWVCRDGGLHATLHTR